MKTRATFFLLSFTTAGFILAAGNSFAQQKSDDQAIVKKTITIHVTKEVDGKTMVVDTTVVTDGDFDTDAYLEKKGVGSDMAKKGENVDKRIVIIHPDSKEFSWSESGKNSPDTVGNMDKQLFIFKDDYDLIDPQEPRGGEPFHYKIQAPDDYMLMQHPAFEDMMEGMLRSFGLENVMPFGEMKQVVVKKKRNGKKVIITFEDRKGESSEDVKGNKKEEKVIIYKNADQGMAPQNDERIFIDEETGEKIIIQKEVRKTGTGTEVIVNTTVDKSAPVKGEKKVIIVTEEEKK
jgi:hypothetical protein